MKKYVILIIALLVSINLFSLDQSADDLDLNNTFDVTTCIKKNNILYKKDTNKPFTGILVSYYMTNNIRSGVESYTPYKDGLPDGEIKFYYQNKQLSKSIIYKGLQPEGPSFQYYADGAKKSEETFKNGKNVGKHIEYYPNGQIKSEITYDNNGNGKFHSYYNNGTLYFEVNKVNYKNSGPSKYYYKTGKLLADIPWKNGVTNGPFSIYFESGKIYTVGKSLDNSFKGVVKYYYESGKLNAVMLFTKDNIFLVDAYSEDGSLILSDDDRSNIRERLLESIRLE